MGGALSDGAAPAVASQAELHVAVIQEKEAVAAGFCTCCQHWH